MVTDDAELESSETSPAALGVIGLGLLGGSLTERLLAAGFGVVGFDIDGPRRDELVRRGGRALDDPRRVAEMAERIVLSLPDSDVVESVIGEIEPSLRAGAFIIDTTTGDPQRTSALGRRLDARGVEYLDATISGSSEQARRGEVIVMAGGAEPAFDACQDVFRAFASRCFHVGSWGSGARMKLVSNLVLGLNRAALAEGLAFASAVGVDKRVALEILKASAAYSRIMDTKGTKMVEEDFTVQARLSQHLKDVRLILAAGDESATRLPLSRTHRDLLEAAEAEGYGELDNSAVIRAYRTRLPGQPNGESRDAR